MLVECYDEKGAEVYEIIIKQIFQDLVLGASVDVILMILYLS